MSHPGRAAVPKTETHWILACKTACLSWRWWHLRRKGMRGEVACGAPLGVPGVWLSLGAGPGPALPFPGLGAPRGVCAGLPGRAWPGCPGTQHTQRPAWPGLAAPGHGQSRARPGPPGRAEQMGNLSGHFCALCALERSCGAAGLC